MKSNKYWFKPKNYGYGAYPSSWEGYTLMLIFIICLFLSIRYTLTKPWLFTLIVFILTSILIFISRIKTEGSWKWRWGGK